MRWRFLICPGLVLLTLLVFGQVINHEFVILDDEDYVRNNPHVTSGLTWENIQWAFSSEGVVRTGNWHPLTWLSLMLDAQLFGSKAMGFHLTNLALHTANVLTLFILLKELTDSIWKSAFVACVFAIHPLHVESVAWITERKDVLHTLFGLLAILWYVRYARRQGMRWYFFSFVALVCSLLSKQMLVTLPFVFLLLDYWPLGRWRECPVELGLDSPNATGNSPDNKSQAQPLDVASDALSWKDLVREKIPFFLLIAAFCVVAFRSQVSAGSNATVYDSPLGYRCLNAASVYVIYIYKTIWPVDLAVYYPYPDKQSLISITVFGAGAILLLLTSAALWQRRRRPSLIVGWLWYLGTLVPVIQIMQIGDVRMADRFTYFPMVGLLIAASWLVSSMVPTGWMREKLLPAIAFSVVITFAAIAWVQTTYWRNSVTLFTRALAVTENNSVAHNCLGTALLRRGHVTAAIDHYRQAISINSRYDVYHANLGHALLQMEKTPEAISCLNLALDINPKNAIAHDNLGVALATTGQFAQAIDHYRQSLDINPNNANAHNNLANALLQQGQVSEAIDHYRRAVEIKSENDTFHLNLGRALFQNRQVSEAIGHFRQALSIDPDNVITHNTLGIALATNNQLPEAISHFRQALSIDPGNVTANANLRRALMESRQD